MTKRLGWAIALAAFIIGAALALRYAENTGMIDDGGARRTMQVLFGLMLAGYANLMPKQLKGPLGSPRAEVLSRSVLRVAGWSLTLAGLAYAGLWAFAPDIADLVGKGLVAAALLLSVGYAVWAFTTCRLDRGASTSR